MSITTHHHPNDNDDLSIYSYIGDDIPNDAHKISAPPFAVAALALCIGAPTLLQGESGMGKSATVEALLKQLGGSMVSKEMGGVTASTVHGVPRQDGTFTEPDWLQKATEQAVDGKMVGVFFDELNRATPEVMALLNTILHGRTLRGRPIPENIRFVIAQNPPTRVYFTANKLETSLQNRIFMVNWDNNDITRAIMDSNVKIALANKRPIVYEIPTIIPDRYYDYIRDWTTIMENVYTQLHTQISAGSDEATRFALKNEKLRNVNMRSTSNVASLCAAISASTLNTHPQQASHPDLLEYYKLAIAGYWGEFGADVATNYISNLNVPSATAIIDGGTRIDISKNTPDDAILYLVNTVCANMNNRYMTTTTPGDIIGGILKDPQQTEALVNFMRFLNDIGNRNVRFVAGNHLLHRLPSSPEEKYVTPLRMLCNSVVSIAQGFTTNKQVDKTLTEEAKTFVKTYGVTFAAIKDSIKSIDNV